MRSLVYALLAVLGVLALGDFASCRNPNDYLAIADQPSSVASPSTSLPSEPAVDPLDPSNDHAPASATSSASKIVRVAVPISCGPRGCTYRYEYRTVAANESGPYVDPNLSPNNGPVADPISTPTYQAASSTGPLRNLFSRLRGRFRAAFARLGGRLRCG